MSKPESKVEEAILWAQILLYFTIGTVGALLGSYLLAPQILDGLRAIFN